MAFDPNRLQAAKQAKFDPARLQASKQGNPPAEAAPAQPSEPPMSMTDALKEGAMGGVRAAADTVSGKPLEELRKVSADPEVQRGVVNNLPLILGTVGSGAGPAGAALGAAGGQGIKDFLQVGMEDPEAPKTTAESLKRQAITGTLTYLGGKAFQAGGKVLGAGGRFVKALKAPSVAEAETAGLPAIKQAGLDKIKPVRFNAGDLDQGMHVQYAEQTAARAKQLPAEELQQYRTTVNNLFRNKKVNPNSPDGKVLSETYKAVTDQLKTRPGMEGVKKGLEGIEAAHAAAPAKKAASKTVSKIGGEVRRAVLNALGLGALYKILG